MSEINNEFMLERALIMSISYMGDLHEKKKIFHGDIKPANIFMCKDGDGFITSDSGSLTLLNDSKDKYFIQLSTPGFSSPQHTSAIKS